MEKSVDDIYNFLQDQCDDITMYDDGERRFEFTDDTLIITAAKLITELS